LIGERLSGAMRLQFADQASTAQYLNNLQVVQMGRMQRILLAEETCANARADTGHEEHLYQRRRINHDHGRPAMPVGFPPEKSSCVGLRRASLSIISLVVGFIGELEDLAKDVVSQRQAVHRGAP